MAAETYSTAQRTAHWLVVALVAFQYFTGEGMAHAFDGVVEDGAAFTGNAWVHGIIGSAILLTMLSRVVLRLRRGAPPPPDTEPGAIQIVSRGNHFAFYAILLAMPLAGLAAVLTLNETVAWLHGLTSKLLLVLIVAHLAGAIWHMTKSDGVIRRMVGRVT